MPETLVGVRIHQDAIDEGLDGPTLLTVGVAAVAEIEEQSQSATIYGGGSGPYIHATMYSDGKVSIDRLAQSAWRRSARSWRC